MRAALLVLGALAGAALLAPATETGYAATGPPGPLPRAHAHNDYEHTRPLVDALGAGFTSVEADVFLLDGQLLVGHEPGDLSAERTLKSLYLDPLAERVRTNGGSVHPGGGSFTLFIDVKSPAVPTYRHLDAVLRGYRDMVTVATAGRVRTGAVTAIVSGNRDLIGMATQLDRVAFYDGRLTDLGAPVPAGLVPLISARWTTTFTWDGQGPMPDQERAQLAEIVATAHRNGQRVRFWATPDDPGPDREAVWRELLAADVDLINTDDLAGLARFLQAHDPEKAPRS